MNIHDMPRAADAWSAASPAARSRALDRCGGIYAGSPRHAGMTQRGWDELDGDVRNRLTARVDEWAG